MSSDLTSVTFRQIGIFLSVASLGSFSKAADSLFLSQSTVSRSIQNLENAVGFPLFLRTEQGVSLTDKGKIIYRELNSMVSRLQDIVQLTDNGIGVDEKKTVTVGYLKNDEIEDHVHRFAEAYQKSHPEISLNLTSYHFSDLRESLIYGFVDCIFTFGIGFGRLRNISISKIATLDSYFAVPASHLPADARTLDTRQLSDMTLYLSTVAEMQSPEERALNICRRYSFEPKAVRYSPARNAIEYAVRSGQGFAIEGKDFNKRFPNEIRMFKIDKPIEDQSVILAWHVNHCPEAALNFINEVTRTARQIEKEKR